MVNMEVKVSVKTTASAYHETLPGSCPPADVVKPQTDTLWRLLQSQAVSDADFKSELLKDPTRKFRDPCGGASISLVPTFEQAVAAVKSPVMRKKNFTHAVAVRYDEKAGAWHLDKPTHCHFWPYFGFDHKALAGEVRAL